MSHTSNLSSSPVGVPSIYCSVEEESCPQRHPSLYSLLSPSLSNFQVKKKPRQGKIKTEDEFFVKQQPCGGGSDGDEKSAGVETIISNTVSSDAATVNNDNLKRSGGDVVQMDVGDDSNSTQGDNFPGDSCSDGFGVSLSESYTVSKPPTYSYQEMTPKNKKNNRFTNRLETPTSTNATFGSIDKKIEFKMLSHSQLVPEEEEEEEGLYYPVPLPIDDDLFHLRYSSPPPVTSFLDRWSDNNNDRTTQRRQPSQKNNDTPPTHPQTSFKVKHNNQSRIVLLPSSPTSTTCAEIVSLLQTEFQIPRNVTIVGFKTTLRGDGDGRSEIALLSVSFFSQQEIRSSPLLGTSCEFEMILRHPEIPITPVSDSDASERSSRASSSPRLNEVSGESRWMNRMEEEEEKSVGMWDDGHRRYGYGSAIIDDADIEEGGSSPTSSTTKNANRFNESDPGMNGNYNPSNTRDTLFPQFAFQEPHDTIPESLKRAVSILVEHDRIPYEAGTAILASWRNRNPILRSIHRYYQRFGDVEGFLNLLKHIVSASSVDDDDDEEWEMTMGCSGTETIDNPSKKDRCLQHDTMTQGRIGGAEIPIGTDDGVRESALPSSRLNWNILQGLIRDAAILVENIVL